MNDKTKLQIERAINKIAEKFPMVEEPSLITDIHINASQESGDLIAYDDNGQEITRVVIDEWINNSSENFYDDVTQQLRTVLKSMAEIVDNMGLLKPYSFVLQGDEGEDIAELYLADDDTIIIGGDLMEGLEGDLNNFLNDLMK
jgi:hypothetical protein